MNHLYFLDMICLVKFYLNFIYLVVQIRHMFLVRITTVEMHVKFSFAVVNLHFHDVVGIITNYDTRLMSLHTGVELSSFQFPYPNL